MAVVEKVLQWDCRRAETLAAAAAAAATISCVVDKTWGQLCHRPVFVEAEKHFHTVIRGGVVAAAADML